MACFITPAAAAVIITKVAKKIPAKYHAEWLLTMLWGGVVMLSVEHIAHKEIVPYFPFLTAMQNPYEALIMLKEMVIVGGTMTLAIFAVWVVLVFAAKLINIYEKRQIKTAQI